DVQEPPGERELRGGLRKQGAALAMPLERPPEGEIDEARQDRGERQQHHGGDHVPRLQVSHQGGPQRRLRRRSDVEGREHGAGRLIRRTDPSTAEVAARPTPGTMPTVNDNLRRLRPRPALIVTACAVAGLCFAARGQQAPEPMPGESPPAIDAEEVTPGEQMGEPDELNIQDIANAVGEAEYERDGG